MTTVIVKELGITENDCHAMTSLIREGLYEKRPQEILTGEVEFDELYIIAGHKEHSESVKKRSKGTAVAEGQTG